MTDADIAPQVFVGQRGSGIKRAFVDKDPIYARWRNDK